MARRELTMNRSMRYGTRMLTAGEPVELTGPEARLFEALKWAGPSGTVRAGKPAHSRRQDPEPVTRRDPLDHDGNGRKGGSAKGAKSTRTKGKARRKAAKA